MSRTGYEEHIRGNNVLWCSMTAEQRTEYSADCYKPIPQDYRGCLMSRADYEAQQIRIERSAAPFGTAQQRERFWDSFQTGGGQNQ